MGKYPTCEACGSQAVVKDAWAEWDYDGQQWVLKTEFDATYCEDCEGWTTIEWVEGEPKEED